MMNQPITVAEHITIPEYLQLLDAWQAAHENPDDPLPPPDADWWEQQQERIKNNPHLTGVQPS